MATGSQQKKSEKLRIFSERFKAALRKSNFQDNEIAEKMRVAPSAISNWRQGLNMAKGKNLRRLAELLKCRPGWLLGEDDHEDAGVMSRAQPSYGKETWQQRALAAEKKLADLRSALRYLLDTGGSLPRTQEKRATSSLEDHPGAASDLEKEGGLDDVRGKE
jgi:transcriptional regulator with XRE-family HTH domain